LQICILRFKTLLCCVTNDGRNCLSIFWLIGYKKRTFFPSEIIGKSSKRKYLLKTFAKQEEKRETPTFLHFNGQ
jgi:hypothetical protein